MPEEKKKSPEQIQKEKAFATKKARKEELLKRTKATPAAQDLAGRLDRIEAIIELIDSF